jgi:hypothetical protein
MKTEPLALATGVFRDVSIMLGPEASAFGSGKPSYLSGQGEAPAEPLNLAGNFVRMRLGSPPWADRPPVPIT